ncbi:MAG TPA: prepilin peptidase [Anaerolineae bacterium]
METFLFALVGWLAGVVVNRAADNLPLHRSLFASPHCPACDAPRPIPEQSGLLGLVFFRGRCSRCGAPSSFRAPIVEIVSAAAFAFLWSRYGATVQTALMAIYTTIFLLVLVTDLEHRLIFNVVIFPAIAFAALASPFSGTGWARALLGGAVAFVIVLAIYLFGKVFERVRGLSIKGGAFGQGDVTLSTFIGLVTGFPFVINAIILGILLGGLGAIATLTYYAVVHRRLALGAVFAYGPYLCIAGWLVMIFRIGF